MYKKKNLFNRVMNLNFKPDQIKQLMGKTFELYLNELRQENNADNHTVNEEEVKIQENKEIE